MRGVVPVLAISILLTGCGPAEGGASDNFAKAVDAYRAGDSAALHAAGEASLAAKSKLPGRISAHEICETLTPAERREVFPALIIDMLDRPTLMSMSEAARYRYFQIMSLRFQNLPELVSSVEGDCGGVSGAISDISTLTAMRKVVVEREKAWRYALEAEFGPQLKPRLEQADRLLQRNGFGAGRPREL